MSSSTLFHLMNVVKLKASAIMSLLKLWLILFIRYRILFSAVVSGTFGYIYNISSEMPDEQRLFHTIMSGYEKSVRPSKKAFDAVEVKLGLSLTQIMDIVNHLYFIR